MNLDTLANIGEFAGALAVVISVLYLAIQIKHNSKTVKSAALQTINDTSIRALSGMAAPGNAEVIVKGREGLGSLNSSEVFQFTTHVTIMMIGFQNTFYQYREGLIPEVIWNRNLLIMRWWTSFVGVQQTMFFVAPGLDPKFVALLDLPARRTPDTAGERKEGTA